MTFSGRIRLYLVAAAVVPSLLVMLVIYLYFLREIGLTDQRRYIESMRKYEAFNRLFQQELASKTNNLKASAEFNQALSKVRSGRTGRLDVDPHAFGLDFLEIVDSTNTVLATYHRPGLLDQRIEVPEYLFAKDSVRTVSSVEYDLNGAHAAFVRRTPISDQVALYTGIYIDESLVQQIALIVDASVEILLPQSALMEPPADSDAARQEVELLSFVLDGTVSTEGIKADSSFFLHASFPLGSSRSTFITLFSFTGIVAISAALIAIIIGFYITGRAKREIDNLVSATARVAEGDFNTPVMAYEEGEFSQLADSFSDMMLKLRQTRQKLATTEKIAAWQTVGRKVAHEIKNPLTPIAISVDDLRRSHAENVPRFDKVLDETTKTIKVELDRLLRLLDEFVSFARMKAPDIQTVKANQLVDDLRALYKADIDSGRVTIDNRSKRTTLDIDPEAFKQVLINLIKNGLEAADDSSVTITVADNDEAIEITIEDTGPGFTDEKLANSFEPYVSTKEGGSGLGLVICHRIVHDHGGTMELYNRGDKGAGVRITLPQ